MVSEPEIIILKEIEIPEARIRLRSDGIVHVHYAKDTTLDLDVQKTTRALYKQITDNTKSKFIFTADEGFTLTKEARENSRNDKDSMIAAYAIIANNLAYRIIANFVLKVNKPKVPFKLFGNVADGIKWLQTL